MSPFTTFLCGSPNHWYLRIDWTQGPQGDDAAKVPSCEWALIQNAMWPWERRSLRHRHTDKGYVKTLNDNSYRLAKERCLGRGSHCWYPDHRLPVSRAGRKSVFAMWATLSMAVYSSYLQSCSFAENWVPGHCYLTPPRHTRILEVSFIKRESSL